VSERAGHGSDRCAQTIARRGSAGWRRNVVKKGASAALIVTSALVRLLTAPQACSAAVIELTVSGRVVVVDPLMLLPPEIHTGEPWSGVIRYSTDLVDQDPEPGRGYFLDNARPDALSITVSVHGHVFAGGFGELSAETVNDWVTIPGQTFQPPPGDSFGLGGPMRQSPFLLDLPSIHLTWNDSSGRALAYDALPLSFDPFLFVQSGGNPEATPEYSPIYVEIHDIGLATPTQLSQYSVFAAIESAEFRIVPEPASLALGVILFMIIIIMYCCV
jgi:hypothetical protein